MKAIQMQKDYTDGQSVQLGRAKSWVPALAAVLVSLPVLTSSAAERVVDPFKPNVVVVPASEAKYVRFVISRCSSHQPCVDELEVYGPDSGENLALADRGAKATACSWLESHGGFLSGRLNDGQYGGAWIAATSGEGWAQIELPRPARINKVVFSTPPTGFSQDRIPARIPTAFEVRLSLDGENWQTVASVTRSAPEPGEAGSAAALPAEDFEQVYSKEATWQETVRTARERLARLADAARQEDGQELLKLKQVLGNEYEKVMRSDWWNDGATFWLLGQGISNRAKTILDMGRDLIWERATADFSSSQDRQTQIWEERDGIWQNDWKGGDVSELAKRYAGALSAARERQAAELAEKARNPSDLEQLRRLYVVDNRCREPLLQLPWRFNAQAMRRAIRDLMTAYPRQYTRGAELLTRLEGHEKRLPEITKALSEGNADEARRGLELFEEILLFQKEALLANPLLDFDDILVIKHRIPDGLRGLPNRFGHPQNWASECDLNRVPAQADFWKGEVCVMSLKHPEKPAHCLFKSDGRFLQHVDLHYDADRLLFSMVGSNGCWQVFEINTDGSGLRQVTPGSEPDVQNADACYLPDGRIVFTSTRAFANVGCLESPTHATHLCLMDADGGAIRMLTFDQDINMHPVVRNNGRVMYLRWEYVNMAHRYPGLLFHMNPDGTGQMEYYGSNSYWPNRVYYARPIPNHPTKVIGVISGHHGTHRAGRLAILDPAISRRETGGAVQLLPGYGKKVERVVQDKLYDPDWPKFLQPYPLSEKHFLASVQLTPDSPFVICLVDVFDNIVPLREEPGYTLLEPIPLRKTPYPPSIPDKVDPAGREAVVFLEDVYQGDGLKGVPKGLVKSLRVTSYNFAYYGKPHGCGHVATPGVDGPWEPAVILGTVPVHEDGSAFFKVPANMPIAVQPLDAEGRALQLMRSWFTAMPGEVLSCIGCHESQNSGPLAKECIASRRLPGEIAPWLGPARGFDFEREIQPVLDRFCVGCHDAARKDGLDFTRKTEAQKTAINQRYKETTQTHLDTVFTPSYIAMHPYVRRASSESVVDLLTPCEFHAATSPLIQILKKGHHGVELDEEAWQRLYTWIDLSAGDHGNWKRMARTPEMKAQTEHLQERRLEMYRLYANNRDDFETLPPAENTPVSFVAPNPPKDAGSPACPQWPFDATERQSGQESGALASSVSLDLGSDRKMEFVLIPAGVFIMGDAQGAEDEKPLTVVKIERPFYVSRCEVSVQQYRTFDPTHDNGVISSYTMDGYHQGIRPINETKQPVVRTSWHRAMAFCEALSGRTGKRVTLPTEAQWEWACRAGTATRLWYEFKRTRYSYQIGHDFSQFENLADRSLSGLANRWPGQLYPIWFLRDEPANDQAMLSTAVGSYQANPFGLHDVHGNVCEWTRTTYQPYPYDENDGRNDLRAGGEKVVRGGSWWDRPNRAYSAFRWKYQPWMKVYNVGFRVIMEVH
ncbi:MAG: SUMF1/EgtB/PvdO family nonheme iron enzyme [Planctomycetota bacterium]